METKILSFEGRFSIWTYDPSHGRLLLRSANRKDSPRRIDIVIQDLRAMELCALFDGIIIEEISEEDILGTPEKAKFAMEPGLRRFRITTSEWSGYIIAGDVFWHADEGGFNEPSVIYKPGQLIKSLGDNGYFPE